MSLDADRASLPVGVFDSGLGGLTVLKEIHKVLPSENLIYFGDTARVPYGNKSAATIIRYSREIAEFLIARDVKAIVVACNTASSYALDALRGMTDIPVLGVIDPAVRSLTQKAPRKSTAGLIATKSTIASHAYDAALERHRGDQFLVSRACPLLVPLIEEGYAESQAADLILRDYLGPMVERGVEYLLLGCTHYPLIAQAILRLYPHLKLIDSAEETAAELKNLLADRGALRSGTKGSVELYVSDMTESMRALKELFFEGAVDRFEIAHIGEQ
ncbi:MAG: glutamate racemase [Spirochaetes bacterium]|nr:glutamate racemase [Spirochaetota bacterium]